MNITGVFEVSKRCLSCFKHIDDEEDVCPHCQFSQVQEYDVDLLPPETILNANYSLGRYLGKGAFGITYLARHLKFTDTLFVIKECYPEDYVYRAENNPQVQIKNKKSADFYAHLNRFIEEAKILHELDHPNVVKVTDCFDGNITSYYVMRYIKGEDLESFIESHGKPNENGIKCLDEELAIKFITDVLNGLTYIHENSIIHRDIKPSNILITADHQVKIIDFGGVKANRSSSSGLTSGSTIRLGTPGYCPPEQTTGRNIGSWSDVYATGATLYKMLTGLEPADYAERIAGAELNWDGSKVAEHLKSAIEDAMQLNRDNRTQTPQDFLQRIKNSKTVKIEDQPEPKGPDDPQGGTGSGVTGDGSGVITEPFSKIKSRLPNALIAIGSRNALIVIGSLVFIVFLWMFVINPQHSQEDDAGNNVATTSESNSNPAPQSPAPESPMPEAPPTDEDKSDESKGFDDFAKQINPDNSEPAQSEEPSQPKERSDFTQELNKAKQMLSNGYPVQALKIANAILQEDSQNRDALDLKRNAAIAIQTFNDGKQRLLSMVNEANHQLEKLLELMTSYEKHPDQNNLVLQAVRVIFKLETNLEQALALSKQLKVANKDAANDIDDIKLRNPQNPKDRVSIEDTLKGLKEVLNQIKSNPNPTNTAPVEPAQDISPLIEEITRILNETPTNLDYAAKKLAEAKAIQPKNTNLAQLDAQLQEKKRQFNTKVESLRASLNSGGSLQSVYAGIDALHYSSESDANYLRLKKEFQNKCLDLALSPNQGNADEIDHLVNYAKEMNIPNSRIQDAERRVDEIRQNGMNAVGRQIR